jgi:hypothetical protein
MYVGSTRAVELTLGTNNREQLVFKSDSISVSDPVEIMGIRFSVADKIPSGVGQPKEIVMVRTARSGQPMMYQCEGGLVWKAMGILAP